MFKTIRIENYRGLKSFELQHLGRVNLLVGTNNSGKTSILEAIQLLCSRTNLEALTKIMVNRGEYFRSEETRGSGIIQSRLELDISHLFYGHEIIVDNEFTISAFNNSNEEKLVFSIRLISESKQSSLPDNDDLDDSKELGILLEFRHESNNNSSLGNDKLRFHLSSNGGINLDNINRRRFREDYKNLPIKTEFITSSSLNPEKMIELFEKVVLTPEEKLINEALQIIEPKIKRIAPVTTSKFRHTSTSRGGFFVLLSDHNQRVPIGSLGDGIWRILGLALAIVSAKDGVLLVDEIDTGLHFTAMSDMWKLIWETAKKLNVQVFATTHNSDCWTSLASIASQEDAQEEGITIQRIEPDKEVSIAFNEREIVIAANRGIEVR